MSLIGNLGGLFRDNRERLRLPFPSRLQSTHLDAMTPQKFHGLGFRWRQEISRGNFSFPRGLETVENGNGLGLPALRGLVVNGALTLLEILDRNRFLAARSEIEVEPNSKRPARRPKAGGRFVGLPNRREQSRSQSAS